MSPEIALFVGKTSENKGKVAEVLKLTQAEMYKNKP
jgi:hypothetical protein